ncbi:MAG: hypothetical protein KKF12_13420 [Proteobacteria bacterium]|nr:hypothetical protein [Desulfobacula sp.]MBU3952363.1 hypothetical protein [Pseudomonadota bacterium]MBU4131815.1 hypothetical protein [Pseudomonadota bacterium]
MRIAVEEKKEKSVAPPRMSPYVFTLLLLGFGLWCFWDGWLTTDQKMTEHALMNQVFSAILIPWAVWDFFKIQRHKKAKKHKED